MKIDPFVTFMKSPEGQRINDECNAVYKEKHTPGPNNIYKELDCDGKVVSKVSHWSHGQFYYHSPACDKCGRKYGFAENALKVGREDFERKMNQVYF